MTKRSHLRLELRLARRKWPDQPTDTRSLSDQSFLKEAADGGMAEVALMGLIGDFRFVLLGEASHGTHDFAVSIWPVCLNGNGGERPFLDQPFRDLRTGVVGVRSRARKQLVCCLSLPRKPTDADSVVKAIGA
jgi:hypothetical protein